MPNSTKLKNNIFSQTSFLVSTKLFVRPQVLKAISEMHSVYNGEGGNNNIYDHPLQAFFFHRYVKHKPFCLA